MTRVEVENLPDEVIIKLITGGEKKYFEILHNRYRDKVLAKCLTMTNIREVAEDLTQDVLIKALKAIETYRGEAKFSTWLYAITYNHCVNYLRENKRIKFDDWESSLEIPEEYDEMEVLQIMDLKKERLVLLLELLKPEDKAILVLKYWEEMDLEQIKYVLNVETVPALKMRLMRARKRLRAISHKFYPTI
ncbi:MAG: RNA polymerase sigma factor [Crocinitomicaceae bacterium]